MNVWLPQDALAHHLSDFSPVLNNARDACVLLSISDSKLLLNSFKNFDLWVRICASLGGGLPARPPRLEAFPHS